MSAADRVQTPTWRFGRAR